MAEAFFGGDDISPTERRILAQYVASNPAEVAPHGRPGLPLLSRTEFLRRLYQLVYKGRVLLIAFNQPFDLTRLAHDVATARGRLYAGGFSVGLWSYRDVTRREQRHHFRPRIAIKHIDSKRALIGFTRRGSPDPEDLIPEDSETGDPIRGYVFRGHFLDLRTLAFALTDRGHTLQSACDAFGVEHAKQAAKEHGRVTPAYVDYNRRDVLATWELAAKLLEEYDRHPIALPATNALSPASIGKAYLRAMGIPPILHRQPDFPPAFLGHAQSAFFGGRTSAHIRKVAVPVVYVDFLSMYPTVNSLMGLWRFVTAKRIRVVKDCVADIEQLLSEACVHPEMWFDPTNWTRLTAFVRVVPNGDILPMRAKFAESSAEWQVALNHLYAGDGPNDSFWFALPDVIASVLLTGHVPTLVDAFRLEAEGSVAGLTPTKIRGTIPVDPTTEDFFTRVIEERKRLAQRQDLDHAERTRLDKALKVLANATSYGIYAQMDRRESAEPTTVICQGIDAEPYSCRVAHRDDPGEYCFPPLASLITAAARLMLALLEHRVTGMGGAYAMEDTDSMAIVAAKTGRLVPCAGGTHRTRDGQPAVKALSWADVTKIAEAFRALNPYDRGSVPGSVLEIEKDNFEPITKRQRQLWCVAISAKRYALFLRDSRGEPVLLRDKLNNHEDRWSEHGLGHLVNPTNPASEDRAWIAQVWLNLVRRVLGLSVHRLGFKHRPAVGRMAITSPPLLRPFAALNRRKPYRNQVKPFNFLSTCHVRAFGHPTGVRPEHFQLIAPHEPDPRRWLKAQWVDRYSAKAYRITTTGPHGGRRTARVQTYGDVIEAYEFHPEAKCADAQGQPCGKQTVGLLQRRHVRIDSITPIGKESNSLEEVQAGLVHDEQNVYTVYEDPRRDYWHTKALPAVRQAPLAILVKACHGRLSRRALIDIRAGRSTPHRKNQGLLASVARKLGCV